MNSDPAQTPTRTPPIWLLAAFEASTIPEFIAYAQVQRSEIKRRDDEALVVLHESATDLERKLAAPPLPQPIDNNRPPIDPLPLPTQPVAIQNRPDDSKDKIVSDFEPLPASRLSQIKRPPIDFNSSEAVSRYRASKPNFARAYQRMQCPKGKIGLKFVLKDPDQSYAGYPEEIKLCPSDNSSDWELEILYSYRAFGIGSFRPSSEEHTQLRALGQDIYEGNKILLQSVFQNLKGLRWLDYGTTGGLQFTFSDHDVNQQTSLLVVKQMGNVLYAARFDQVLRSVMKTTSPLPAPPEPAAQTVAEPVKTPEKGLGIDKAEKVETTAAPAHIDTSHLAIISDLVASLNDSPGIMEDSPIASELASQYSAMPLTTMMQIYRTSADEESGLPYVLWYSKLQDAHRIGCELAFSFRAMATVNDKTLPQLQRTIGADLQLIYQLLREKSPDLFDSSLLGDIKLFLDYEGNPTFTFHLHQAYPSDDKSRRLALLQLAASVEETGFRTKISSLGAIFNLIEDTPESQDLLHEAGFDVQIMHDMVSLKWKERQQTRYALFNWYESNDDCPYDILTMHFPDSLPNQMYAKVREAAFNDHFMQMSLPKALLAHQQSVWVTARTLTPLLPPGNPQVDADGNVKPNEAMYAPALCWPVIGSPTAPLIRYLVRASAAMPAQLLKNVGVDIDANFDHPGATPAGDRTRLTTQHLMQLVGDRLEWTDAGNEIRAGVGYQPEKKSGLLGIFKSQPKPIRLAIYLRFTWNEKDFYPCLYLRAHSLDGIGRGKLNALIDYQYEKMGLLQSGQLFPVSIDKDGDYSVKQIIPCVESPTPEQVQFLVNLALGSIFMAAEALG